MFSLKDSWERRRNRQNSILLSSFYTDSLARLPETPRYRKQDSKKKFYVCNEEWHPNLCQVDGLPLHKNRLQTLIQPSLAQMSFYSGTFPDPLCNRGKHRRDAFTTGPKLQYHRAASANIGVRAKTNQFSQIVWNLNEFGVMAAKISYMRWKECPNPWDQRTPNVQTCKKVELSALTKRLLRQQARCAATWAQEFRAGPDLHASWTVVRYSILLYLTYEYVQSCP